jgi:oleate hydratase
MVANSSNWDTNKVPILKDNKTHPSWKLWEKISKNNPEFWVPKVFNSDIEKTKWTAFTITFKNPTFFKLMEKFVSKKVTSHGWVTLLDSNWFASIVLFHKPYFKDQPKDVKLARWYSLFSEKKWNFVKKKMTECTWKEILTEIVYHLKLEKHLDSILKDTVCIPSLTPYVTSHFLPRKAGDRPNVIPKNTTNLAFIWQFCEIPKDIVFTVEYSIRSAQIAVKSLFNLDKKITPIYKWYFDLKILFWALNIIFRK